MMRFMVAAGRAKARQGYFINPGLKAGAMQLDFIIFANSKYSINCRLPTAACRLLFTNRPTSD